MRAARKLDRAATAAGARFFRWMLRRPLTRSPSVVPLLLVFLGIWLACTAAASMASPAFERSPMREDPAQADWLRQNAKQAQEQYRLRVAIPRSSVVSLWADGTASHNTGAPAPGFFNRSGTLPGQNLMLIIATCLCALLCISKLMPETMHSVFGAIGSQPCEATVPAQSSAIERADEQAFKEFLVAFKAGPTSTTKGRRSPVTANASGSVEGPAMPMQCEERDSLGAFFSQGREHLLAMRHLLQEIGRESQQSPKSTKLGELRDRLLALKDDASRPELLPIWQVASAVAGLVGQLVNRNNAITPNTLRTVASGLDLLIELCQAGVDPKLSTEPPIRLLAVDDDLLSRHAVALSLKKAYNQPDLAANGEAALAQALLIHYDVIFLDVQMPHMDGFELCAKIRETSLNRETPIVFVTCHSELDARAKCNLSGGTDLIGKPFLTFEITVKALVLALRARLDKRKAKPSPCLAQLSLAIPCIS